MTIMYFQLYREITVTVHSVIIGSISDMQECLSSTILVQLSQPLLSSFRLDNVHNNNRSSWFAFAFTRN